MTEYPIFDCPLCSSETRGSCAHDESAMLCRDCTLEWIMRATGTTLEERVASVGWPESDAAAMRELFAVRHDQAQLHRLSRKQRIDEFAALRRGWRNGDGESVPPAVLEWAYRWVREASDEEIEAWRVYPDAEGGLRFERCEGQFGVHDDSVCVLEHKIAYHFMTWTMPSSTEARRTTWSAYVEVAFAPPHEVLLIEEGRE